jgi:hypothetical protein
MSDTTEERFTREVRVHDPDFLSAVDIDRQARLWLNRRTRTLPDRQGEPVGTNNHSQEISLKTGKEIAEIVLADEEFMSGLPMPRQREIMAAYTEANLPGALGDWLDKPATFANILGATAACLRDMLEKGVIVDIVMARPTCATCTCCDEAPQIEEWMCANIAALGQASADAAGHGKALVQYAPGLWVGHGEALLMFGLTEENTARALGDGLTVGELLESQPHLFLHPHTR